MKWLLAQHVPRFSAFAQDQFHTCRVKAYLWQGSSALAKPEEQKHMFSLSLPADILHVNRHTPCQQTYTMSTDIHHVNMHAHAPPPKSSQDCYRSVAWGGCCKALPQV